MKGQKKLCKSFKDKKMIWIISERLDKSTYFIIYFINFSILFSK